MATDCVSKEVRIEASRCGCKSWFCDFCAVGMGLRLRTMLSMVMEEWDVAPFMITLTVDPKLFETPEQAYDFGAKRIGRFVDLLRRSTESLRSKFYFTVLEEHESGWPHWHLCVDACYLPYDVVRHCWNILGQREGLPHLGRIHCSPPKGGWTCEGAIAYLTKYLTKTPSGGWSDWIMNRTSKVPRYTACQGLNLQGKACPVKPQAVDPEGQSCGEVRGVPKMVERASLPRIRSRTAMTHGERVANCGGHTVVRCVEEVVACDGEVCRRGRHVAKVQMDLFTFSSMFGLDSEGVSSVVLEGVAEDELRGLCDSARRARERRRSWRRARDAELAELAVLDRTEGRERFLWDYECCLDSSGVLHG